TIAMRAIADNPMQQLLPGQHVRVDLRDKQSIDVVTIPRRAVQTDLEGDFVMVLVESDASATAERRNIEMGRQVEGGVI
ncbi:efflux transporter periplasmic adaptor subunit, partial [Vibrio sp. 10N.286.49.E1]